MKDPKKVAMGKKSKAAGARFELKVRKDLESKGWIVSKWMNNIRFWIDQSNGEETSGAELIPAKHKFRGTGIPMAIGTGFPDFIAFGHDTSQWRDLIFDKDTINPGNIEFKHIRLSCIIGVESKSNGYLDKEEKEKCFWLLQNKVFSKILVASKYKEKNKIKIKYEDFEEKYGNKIR